MLGALALAPALLPSTRTLAPSLVAGRRHPRPSAIVWHELSKELDATVPVYVVANQAGRPCSAPSGGGTRLFKSKNAWKSRRRPP